MYVKILVAVYNDGKIQLTSTTASSHMSSIFQVNFVSFQP